MSASPEVEYPGLTVGDRVYRRENMASRIVGRRVALPVNLTHIARDCLCTANYSRLARIEMLIRM
jgi:hypothetical protein